MIIEYYHASVYGNGASVAEEFKRRMEAAGATVNIHNLKHLKPKEVPPADLYFFSSPGRFGKPTGDMRNFLKKADLPAGARYAAIATELCPQPDKKGNMPSEEELGKCQRVIPFMDEALQKRGLVKAAEGKILVTGIKGPLEEGWQEKVASIASRLATV